MTYIIQICRPVKETYTNGPQSYTHMTSVSSNQLSQWHIVVLSLFHSDVANHYGWIKIRLANIADTPMEIEHAVKPIDGFIII